MRTTGRLAVSLLTATALLTAGCSSDDDRPEERAPDADASDGSSTTEPPDAPPLEPLSEETPEELLPYYEQQLNWRGCGAAEFQCASLTVPLDYEDPNPADDIQLTVTRSRATDQDERIGALLMNPGGPGASAVDFAQGSAEFIYADEVRARYDMVGLDARGTGQSEPVSCLEGPEMDAYTLVDRTPDDEAEVDALTAAQEEFARGCQEGSGALLEHISTIESARDMDVLRQALGDERLHYVGFSYGTKLGAVYAGLYPQRVGHLVLDAAMDPRLDTLSTDREQAGGFETAFRAFAEDCVSGADCPLGQESADDASQRLLDFFAAVDAEPLPSGDERELTESLATTGVAYALYSEDLWPTLRRALAAAIEDGQGGELLTLADSYNGRTPGGGYDTDMFAFPAISCLDSPAGNADADAVREQLPSYEEASPTFGADFAWATLVCAAWPVEPSGGPVSIAAEGADPILVVGTTRDPATPYAWSEGLADQLSSGVLLTYEGDGHTAYGGLSECVDSTVNDYLLANTVPDDGTTC
ncbi:tripeptidyl-peptidase B. Serine peptidase. MEROPS family S33 [Streptomyces zhaozhouensis]|uniref:Tripeptidyl-peptidase B. Serine peptidase. MEROPS family S33 n=1 Tax=Streptomyces zhaozhouensis TaxID=1300267 RepID=A0A286DWX4_9ACTN|nr:alpha/beta hydrolase [Streptomyces zhaozhouensis]SOD63177.1 tripeptidyl-peptidase B. Serine peptidase. MEROPS family S33 [Streptomyces zhaozhouensis]